MKHNQHVVQRPTGWAVKGTGNEKATRILPTQKQAIGLAVRIARTQQAEVVIHGRNGKIRDKDSYGNDPSSIKDRKH